LLLRWYRNNRPDDPVIAGLEGLTTRQKKDLEANYLRESDMEGMASPRGTATAAVRYDAGPLGRVFPEDAEEHCELLTELAAAKNYLSVLERRLKIMLPEPGWASKCTELQRVFDAVDITCYISTRIDPPLAYFFNPNQNNL
jgi:hypothetical protein